MATAFYCIPATTADADVTVAMSDRATALGCTLIKGDPTGLVSVYPSAVVTSTTLASVVIPDDTGQATAAEISTALLAAQTAENNYQQAITTATSNIEALVTQMGPMVAQGQADLATLASSTDSLAPIIANNVKGSLALAQGLADVVVALKLIAASEILATGL